tara:strand:- start:1947 stop:3104 length:1158 start_codon:yes stop_codon:yes gene_type:complete
MLLSKTDGIDFEKKISNVNFFVIDTKISSGKMHGQADNIKPIGYITISCENVTGISEIYASTYISHGIKSIYEYMAFVLNNKTLKDAIKIFDNFSIPFVSRNGLFRACFGSLENAFYDLCAKLENKPLYQILGPEKDFPKIYASGGSVICSKEEIEKESVEVLDSGFQGYKIRVGLQEWDVDQNRIRAMGDSSLIKMVDAINGTRIPSWNLGEVEEKIPFLESQNIYWLEEPLYPDEYTNHATLQNKCSFHIAAGEAYSGYGEFKNLIDIGKIDIIQFDACHSGGISLCKKVSEYAEKNKRKNAIHVWGSAVAINTNFHMAIALGNIDFLEKPLIELQIDDKLNQEFIDLKGLKNNILERPGIGIEINDFKEIETSSDYGFEYRW